MGVSLANVVNMKAQIISSDMVAADTAAARMMNIEPDYIDYIPISYKMGIGNMDLSGLEIKRISM